MEATSLPYLSCRGNQQDQALPFTHTCTNVSYLESWDEKKKKTKTPPPVSLSTRHLCNSLFCGWCLLQWAPTWQITSAADAASLWYQHNLILKISLHSAAVCFAQSRFAWWILFCIKHDIKVENSKLYYISVIFYSASKATAVPTWQGQWRHHRHSTSHRDESVPTQNTKKLFWIMTKNFIYDFT